MTKRKKLYIILAVVLLAVIATIIIIANLPPKIDEISGLPCISWWDAWKIEAGMTKEDVIDVLGDEYAAFRSYNYPDECEWPLPDGRGFRILFIPEDGFYKDRGTSLGFTTPRTDWRAVCAYITDKCAWSSRPEETIFEYYSWEDEGEDFSFPIDLD